MKAFINIYNAGKAVIVAAPVRPGNLLSVLQRAYYEHGLKGPDYTVFQTEQQAKAAI